MGQLFKNRLVELFSNIHEKNIIVLLFICYFFQNTYLVYFHVSNLIVESNELSKPGLEVEIGRDFIEI
jgi:hypothetical protein